MKRTNRLVTRSVGLACVFALTAVVAACSDDEATTPAPTLPLLPRIAVTSVKGDDVSQLLAAIFARVLDDAGFRIARKDPVALDRAGYYQALQDGEFELIPDFSGDLQAFLYNLPGSGPLPSTSIPEGVATTGVPVTYRTTTTTTTVADTSTTTTDPDATTTSSPATSTSTTTSSTSTTTTSSTTTTTPVEQEISPRSVPGQLISINEVLDSSVIANRAGLAEDKTVIACTPEAMVEHEDAQLVSLTDLASLAPTIRLGGTASFMDDELTGYGALQAIYGGEFEELVTLAQDEFADSVANGDVDCVALNSLDPLITKERLTLLLDPLHMSPGNGVVALVATNVSTPDLTAVFDGLISVLTSQRLNQMLNEVVTNGTDPNIVANAFVDSL